MMLNKNANNPHKQKIELEAGSADEQSVTDSWKHKNKNQMTNNFVQ